MLFIHSSWASLSGCASQLLVRTGPFERERSVYIAVIVARLIMNPGLRIFGAVVSPVDPSVDADVDAATGGDFGEAYVK